MNLYVAYTYEDRVPARQLIAALKGRYTIIDAYAQIAPKDILDERIRRCARDADKILIVLSQNSERMAFRDNWLPIIKSARPDLAASTIVASMDGATVPKDFEDCTRLSLADLSNTLEPLYLAIEGLGRTPRKALAGRKGPVRPPTISGADADSPLPIIEQTRVVASADCRVVQNYFRWDEATVNDLKGWASRIKQALQGPARSPETFLFGGTSGSGKTYFVQQIAADFGTSINFVPFDFSKIGRQTLMKRVKQASETDKPVLIMIDEVDTQSSAIEYYDRTFQLLEENETSHPRACVLLGSSEGGFKSVISSMKARPPKCHDMATRVNGHDCFDVPELTLYDRLAIVRGQVEPSLSLVPPESRRIEKLAAYYILTGDGFDTARAIAKLMKPTLRRFNKRDATNGILYEDLFEPGDARGRRFLAEHSAEAEKMRARYISFN